MDIWFHVQLAQKILNYIYDRWVSTAIHGHPNEDLEDNQMSLMVMQFGQFLGWLYHFEKFY
jgi:hypothetical protein